jgi:hypothetical protein
MTYVNAAVDADGFGQESIDVHTKGSEDASIITNATPPSASVCNSSSDPKDATEVSSETTSPCTCSDGSLSGSTRLRFGNNCSWRGSTLESQTPITDDSVNAGKLIQDTFQASNSESNEERILPTWSRSELFFGKFLGRGASCTVEEIRGMIIHTDSSNNNNNTSCPTKERNSKMKEFMAVHCIRASGNARYAIKQLSSSALNKDKYISDLGKL